MRFGLEGVSKGGFLCLVCFDGLNEVCKSGIAAMTRPLPVIPSVARKLMSMTARPDIQCHIYTVTKS